MRRKLLALLTIALFGISAGSAMAAPAQTSSITPDPARINVGKVTAGSISNGNAVTFTNAYGSALALATITVSDGKNVGAPGWLPTACTMQGNGGTCTITIYIGPLAKGHFSGKFNISWNFVIGGQTSVLVPFSGSGVAAPS